MTKEEASFILTNIDRRVCDKELNEALDMAVEALKQEPCEDCISREALLTSLEEPMNWTDSEAEIQQQRDYEGFIDLVKNMPSVVEHTIQSRK